HAQSYTMRKAGCASTTCRFYGGATALIAESPQCQSSHHGGSTNDQFSAVAHQSVVTRVTRLRHACKITRLRFYLDGPFPHLLPVARIRLRHPVERETQLRGIDHAAEDRHRGGDHVRLSVKRPLELPARAGDVLLLRGQRAPREDRDRQPGKCPVVASEEAPRVRVPAAHVERSAENDLVVPIYALDQVRGLHVNREAAFPERI